MQEMKGKEGTGDPRGQDAKSGPYSSASGLSLSGANGFFADVVRYHLVWCVCLAKSLSSTLMKLLVQGQVRIVRLMCVLRSVLPCLHLPKKEGDKRGRRIVGRELDSTTGEEAYNLY